MRKLLTSLFLGLGLVFMFANAASADSNNTSQPITFVTSVTQSTYTTMDEALLENEVKPLAEIQPTYPGTNITMKPGDVIHNPKSFSTFFVGHVAIVGPDLRIYHVHPNGPGIVESIDSYVSRFSSGDKFTIFRIRDGGGPEAAEWAKANISKVNQYFFNPIPTNVGGNYCSKFVWQAYYFGINKELVFDSKSLDPLTYILPSDILNSPILVKTGTFYK
ncbi:hypothetical protein [Paenibacillus macerans]|uniref:hypothetical protein n=1 Tax=Paenibacillus macerans TaxID=44252 RepID=UPI00203F3617|nr:hypothetical protein [Paenibacillus macerans]MCM3697824.1 hypothetical protein [Paenibacillus macerans]